MKFSSGDYPIYSGKAHSHHNYPEGPHFEQTHFNQYKHSYEMSTLSNQKDQQQEFVIQQDQKEYDLQESRHSEYQCYTENHQIEQQKGQVEVNTQKDFLSLSSHPSNEKIVHGIVQNNSAYKQKLKLNLKKQYKKVKSNQDIGKNKQLYLQLEKIKKMKQNVQKYQQSISNRQKYKQIIVSINSNEKDQFQLKQINQSMAENIFQKSNKSQSSSINVTNKYSKEKTKKQQQQKLKMPNSIKMGQKNIATHNHHEKVIHLKQLMTEQTIELDNKSSQNQLTFNDLTFNESDNQKIDDLEELTQIKEQLQIQLIKVSTLLKDTQIQKMKLKNQLLRKQLQTIQNAKINQSSRKFNIQEKYPANIYILLSFLVLVVLVTI